VSTGHPKLIKAAVFPIREPSVTIPVMLRELSNQGYLTLFSTSDSKHFGVINNFAKHQVVNKPRASKIKCLELLPESYGSDTGDLPLGMDQGSGIREWKGNPLSMREGIFGRSRTKPQHNFGE
jgi:DNA replication protein DnaT